MSQSQLTTTSQSIPPSVPIDPQPLIDRGTEPVSIILALAILISILLGSVTGLIQVILILRQTKLSR